MTKISLAVLTALTIIVSAKWLAEFVFRDNYPDTLAVEVEGFDGPLVNREVIQRDWPKGLESLKTRAQFRSHMGHVENFEVPEVLGSATPQTPAPEPDLATLLAAADISNGERRARACAACHTFDDGGRDGVGPNLWAVLGRDIAAVAAYDYSPALANEAGDWSYEKLDAYLFRPSEAIPGNKMAFQGIRRARDRADIIAFMRMQGASQLPLPDPPPPSEDAEETEE